MSRGFSNPLNRISLKDRLGAFSRLQLRPSLSSSVAFRERSPQLFRGSCSPTPFQPRGNGDGGDGGDGAFFHLFSRTYSPTLVPPLIADALAAFCYLRHPPSPVTRCASIKAGRKRFQNGKKCLQLRLCHCSCSAAPPPLDEKCVNMYKNVYAAIIMLLEVS